MLTMLNRSVWLSYLGVALSLVAVYVTINHNPRWAMLLFILAGLCDLFDGVIARSMSRTDSMKRFGFEIDSLCDMVSFAAFPFVFLLHQPIHPALKVSIGTVYVLAAITRLAYFNVLERGQDTDQRQAYFTGLPVTYSALVLPIVILLLPRFDIIWQPVLLLVSYIGLAYLFVSDHPIPKPGKPQYILLLILAVATFLGLVTQL